ncbi:MAG: hypothetical protein RLZZ118_1686 [Bacteroidota bacterium]
MNYKFIYLHSKLIMINKILNTFNLKLIKTNSIDNIENNILKDNIEFSEFYNLCKLYTMTSMERLFSLYNSTNYIIKNNIPGDFVECGVWKGGSSMMIALVLNKNKIFDRKIYMYDTYEGMSEPDENDLDISGQSAKSQLINSSKENQKSVWCFSSLDEVKRNVTLTNFPMELFQFVVGKVEDTIPDTIPIGEISLLRLDTDWYASTKQELIHLYPKLVKKGVLIIDNYGHWQGCRKAVDEYFKSENINLLLNVIDYTGRSAIKI